MARNYRYQVTDSTGIIIGLITEESTTKAKALAATTLGSDIVKRVTSAQAKEIERMVEMNIQRTMIEINETTDLQEKLNKLIGLGSILEMRNDQTNLDIVNPMIKQIEAELAAATKKIDTAKKTARKDAKATKKSRTAVDIVNTVEEREARNKVRDTVTVDMSKAKAPKAKKVSKNESKVVRMRQQDAIEMYMTMIKQQDTADIDCDGHFKVIKQETQENGTVIIMTYANNKETGKRYRTLVFGKRGGIQAWGCRTKGTPKYLTIPHEVIEHGWFKENNELLAHPIKKK